MSTQSIRFFGDPVLATPSLEVVTFDKELRNLVKDVATLKTQLKSTQENVEEIKTWAKSTLKPELQELRSMILFSCS